MYVITFIMLLLLLESDVKGRKSKSPSEEEDLNKPIYNMPVLGRPVALGMFYDAVTGKVIMGSSLFSQEELKNYSSKESIGYVKKEVCLSDQYKYNRDKFDLSLSLTGDLFGGVIKLTGSAKYFQDKRTQNNQVKIAHQVEYKPFSMKLHQDALRELTFKKGFTKVSKFATHIVSKIVFGAKGYFVYEFEETQFNISYGFGMGIKAVLDAVVAKVTGEVSLSYDLDKYERKSQMQVRFFGDIMLPYNPTSLNDSKKLIHDSYTFLGKDQEKAIPMYMDLKPVSDLDSRERDLIEKVKVNKMQQVEEQFEDIQDTLRLCQDCLNVAKKWDIFPIRKAVARVSEYVTAYHTARQRKLGIMLPLIRRGEKPEKELVNYIKEFKRSPYCYRQVGGRFLYEAGKHAEIIQTAIQHMPSARTIREPNLLVKTLIHHRYVFVYIFREATYTQPFITQLKANLDGGPGLKKYDIYRRTFFNESRTELALRLEELAAENTEDTDFLILNNDYNTVKASKTHPIINFYESGQLVDKQWDIPSVAGPPYVISSTHDTLLVGWREPVFGRSNVAEYRVTWKSSIGAMTEFTSYSQGNVTEITELEAGVGYTITIQPLIMPALQVAKTSSKTLLYTRPSSRPGQPQPDHVNDSSITIVWSEPMMVSPYGELRGYQVSYHRVDELGRPSSGNTSSTALITALSFSLHDLPINVSYRFYVTATTNVHTSSDNSVPLNSSLPSLPSMVITTGPKCESGWFRLSSYCYFVSRNYQVVRKPYQGARFDCRSRGGQLAEILDVEESYMVTGWCNGQHCWIGLSQAGDGGGWRWESGAEYERELIPWAHSDSGTLNSTKGMEHCAYINEHYTVEHTKCGGEHTPAKHYICKKHILKKTGCIRKGQ